MQAPDRNWTGWESDGSGGLKHHVQGAAGDGSQINYNFTAKPDGKDVPISGSGAPGGAWNVQKTKRKDGSPVNAAH